MRSLSTDFPDGKPSFEPISGTLRDSGRSIGHPTTGGDLRLLTGAAVLDPGGNTRIQNATFDLLQPRCLACQRESATAPLSTSAGGPDDSRR